MKFKKILAVLINVIMLFGSLSAIPATNVYAADDEAKTAEMEIDCPNEYCAPGSNISVRAYAHDANGEINNFAWSVTGASNLWNEGEPPAEAKEYTYIKSDTVSPGAITLHIGTKEPNNEKITITASAKNSSISASCVLTVWNGVHFSVDYRTGFGLLQSNGEDDFLFLEVSKKEGDAQGKGTVYCYRIFPQSESEVRIDLSFLKLSKNVYVYAYGDCNTKALKQDIIYAMPKKVSVKFTYKPGAKFSECFTVKKGAIEDLEYRKQGDSMWKPLLDLEGEINNLMVTGTTLLVRQIGKDNADKSSMPGSEIKLKIPAAPKAPKIKLNYAKNTITLVPNSQVRVPGWSVFAKTEEGYKEEPYYYEAGKNKMELSPVKLREKLVDGYIEKYNQSVDQLQLQKPKKTAQDREELLKDLAEGCTLLIRTSDSKKGNSQFAFTDIKESPVIEVVSGAAIDGSTTVVIGTVATVMTNSQGQKIYGSEKMTFQYDMTSGKEKVTLTASENNLFAYSLDGGRKFTKIKTDGTDVKLSKVKSNILIRMEGFEDREDEVQSRWASNTVELPKNN